MQGIKFSLVVVCLCFFVSGVFSTLSKNSEIYPKQTSLISRLKDTHLFGEFLDSSLKINTSCDCGENSGSCELKNGFKICQCKPGYAPGEYQNCAPTCNRTQKCENGGSCFNDVCVCLPGTSGPYCAVIDGCSELNCGKDKNANCSYDQKKFKAFCSCKQKRYEFDYDDNTCKECDCEQCPIGKFCFSSARKCEFIFGEKTCTCIPPDNKFNPKSGRCESCSVLKKEEESCDFDQNGETVKVCKRNFQQKEKYCYECDCGYGGSCRFIKRTTYSYDKVCSCKSGYSDDRGTCRECDCGHGKCVFDWNYRKTKCNCDSGYFEESGKCRERKTCYCGENATCQYVEDVKKCDCPQGYREINGLCADINECEEDPNTCPSSMTCTNNDGGYECSCRKGFQESPEESQRCDDINECLSPTSCPEVETQCLNTLGSYKCYCKPGYATRVDEDSSVICESKSGWKLGYGLLIGSFIVVIGILMLMIYKYL